MDMSPKSNPHPTAHASHTAQVLVVDDSLVMRNLLKAAVTKQGFLVTAVESGAQAIEELGLGNAEERGICRFDLVLLDNMMPEMTGIEALRQIRETYSPVELPVMIVTANDESADIVTALQAGANDHVTKPIDLPVLFARMTTHVGYRKSHQDLRDSQRSLIHSAKMESVAHLAAGVAHEIRNPLAAIQMAVDGALQAVGDGNSMATEFLNMSVDSIKRADGIVTELVHYSTSTNLKLVSANLNDFVNESLTLMEEEFDTYAMTVKREFGDNPQALVSAGELQQIFLNLLFNALQATGAEGTLIIRTGTRQPTGLETREGSRSGAHVRDGDPAAFIDVLDDGPGISQGDLSKIFDPFFTSKATGKSHGKGLGLTVARQLAELHGGAIQISNLEPGPGLQATVYLRCEETAML
jgi:two-component system, NtrC family, sensor kinase